MPMNSTFLPPYLDYGVPADLKKIQAEMAAIWRSVPRPAATLQASTVSGFAASANPRGGFTVANAALEESPVALETVASGTSTTAEPVRSASPARFGAVRGESFAVGDVVRFQPTSDPAATAAAASASKAAASLVSVIPNGVVPIGFNCWKTFKAEAASPGFKVSHLVWRMLLKNKSGGTNQLFYMGWTNPSGNSNPFPVIAEFSHRFETYSMMAYTSPSNTVEFVIECQYFPFDPNVAIRTEVSAPVTLNFNVPACLSLHSLAVSTDTVTGGDNGSEPTLTVALDKPAGPGGQRVALSTSNNLGRIMHTPDFPGSFVIPAGQTSGSVSWFLGTKRVYTTGRSFHIHANLVSPGGQSNEGVIEIHRTKQKK